MRFDRRISRRSFLAAAGATSAVLALTACGGSSSSVAASSASGTASSAAGTAQGGTLNIMLETEVQSLDPQVATDGTSSYNKIVVFIDRSPAGCYNNYRVLWIGLYHLPSNGFAEAPTTASLLKC